MILLCAMHSSTGNRSSGLVNETNVSFAVSMKSGLQLSHSLIYDGRTVWGGTGFNPGDFMLLLPNISHPNSQLAKEYDEKHGKTMEKLIDHVRSLRDFIGADWVSGEEDKPKKEVRLLDYACGTGMVSRALLPLVSSAVGIDVTEKMVSIYNTKAHNQGLSESEMHAYLGDICTPDPSSSSLSTNSSSSASANSSSSRQPPAPFAAPRFHDFDVAAVGLGFHHFASPHYAATQLSARLRPGGVLFIIDFLPHEEPTHDHAARHTITRHGFSRDDVQAIFEGAGCGKDFGLVELGKGGIVFEGMGKDKKSVTKHVFLARGTKE